MKILGTLDVQICPQEKSPHRKNLHLERMEGIGWVNILSKKAETGNIYIYFFILETEQRATGLRTVLLVSYDIELCDNLLLKDEFNSPS